MCAVYCYVSYASLNRKTHGPQGHIPRDSDSVDLGRFWIASVVTSSPGDYGDQSGCWGWGRPGLECKKDNRQEETFGGGGYVYGKDCGDGFMGIYSSPNSSSRIH